MLGLKKYFHNELLHLTIILSLLLRIDPDSYLQLDHGIEVAEIMLGSSSAFLPIQLHNVHNRLSGYAHPKNLDNLLLNHQSIFNELNLLGRYNRFEHVNRPREIATYLLNAQEPVTVKTEIVEDETNDTGGSDNLPDREENPVSTEEEPPTEDCSQEEATASTASQLFFNWEEMSKEDMDLIEILLRQDIDLGVTREVFDVQLRKDAEKVEEDSIEGVKLDIKNEKTLETPPVCDPWSGLNYTIDSETGEHVVLENGEETGTSDSGSVLAGPSLTSSDLLSLSEELDNIPLEDLGLSLPFEELTLPDDEPDEINKDKDDSSEGIQDSILRFDRQNSFSEQLHELEDMIQTAQLHHAHPGRGLQARGPYLRSVSMEQRWQDLTNLLSIPTASEAEMHHHHHHYHHNMSMGMLHGAGHVPQHNYSIPSYASIDNRTVLLQNATLPPPVADINSNMSYQGEVGSDPSAISSAVVTSMSALTNSSDPLVDPVHHGHYQMDSGVMMFPSNHTEVNQTTEGFLSAILNDEDLQLMDMAMNEGDPSFTLPVSRKTNGTEHVNDVHPVHVGMYTMRMLDNEDAMDTSSDSAVSSMGSSERVPSISDGEWMETASESSHPDDQDRYYGMECTQSKFRQYNYSYAPGMAPGQRANVPTAGSDGGSTSLDRRMPPVAQKKYQLFGKRLPVEQSMGGGSPYGTLPRGNATMPQPANAIKYPDYIYPSPQDHNSSSSYGSLEGATAPNSSLGSVEQKYSCRVEFTRQQSVEGPANVEHVQHNHTYQLSSESMHDMQRPTLRDKQKKKMNDEHVSRDEKRARSMKLPLTSEEIINLPMDEFNERLSKYDLTEAQLALIRDIRRRGKNKVAAQNCRKRKLDQILLLAEEVHGMQREREQLIHDNQAMVGERQRLKDKFSQLYRHVFQSLRDPDGNPYSPYDYSLQQAADGNILLVPRNGTTNQELDPSKGAKNKRKEDDKK